MFEIEIFLWGGIVAFKYQIHRKKVNEFITIHCNYTFLTKLKIDFS